MIVIIGTGTIANELDIYFKENDIQYSLIPFRDIDSINTAISYIKVKITSLIITSGYLSKKDFKDITKKEIENMAKANVLQPMFVINTLYNRLKKDKTKIVVFSSSVIKNYRKEYNVYHVFKKALEVFIENISSELDTLIVRNSRTDTKLRWSNYEKNETTLKNLLSPLEVVKSIYNFLKENKNGNILEIYKENEVLKTNIKEF